VHSDVLPVTTVDDYAENILAQQISQIPGIAQVSIGGQQKPAVRVQIDPVKLAALGCKWRTSPASSRRHGRCAEGLDQRPEAQHDDLRQRSAAEGRALERRGRRLQERRAGAHPRHRRRGRRAGKYLLTAWQNGHNGILLLIYKQPGANVIDAEQRVEALLPHALASVPPRSRWTRSRTAPPPSRPRCSDVEFTLVLTIAWW
jgi:hypothetical protein